MKRLHSLLFVVFTAFALTAFGQDVGPAPEVSESEFLMALFTSMGGMKGAGSLAAVGALLQLAMLALKTKIFGSIAGKYRLLAITALSMLGGVLALRVQGLDWAACLIHSSTLASFQVFLHQIYKQFTEKTPSEKPEQSA